MNFVWKNSVSPKGVLWIKQSLSHQRFMANSPHSEQGHIVPYLYSQNDQTWKWSLPTVNISKCLAESQFFVIQTVLPDALLGRITHSEFEIHDVISADWVWTELWHGDYSAISPFPCLRRTVGGGTRGNSCLGRRFLWASRSGHIHKARQEARWDGTPIYCIWMWACVCV